MVLRCAELKLMDGRHDLVDAASPGTAAARQPRCGRTDAVSFSEGIQKGRENFLCLLDIYLSEQDGTIGDVSMYSSLGCEVSSAEERSRRQFLQSRFSGVKVGSYDWSFV